MANAVYECTADSVQVRTELWVQGHSPPSSCCWKLASEPSISSNGGASLLISVFNNTYIQGLFMNSLIFFSEEDFLVPLFIIFPVSD